MTVRAYSVTSTLQWQRLLPLLYWPWDLLGLLGLFGWFYLQTMPPGMSSWLVEGWDSAMLQIAGSTWGVPHSPGYPLYIVLANLFVRLLNLIPGLWDTSVVWRVTLWSTVNSLLALTFLYFAGRKLARNRGAALIATGLLAQSFIFWRAAIMAEVYSFNAMIFTLVYWLALIWDDDPRDRWLVALGLALGAGLAHHRTAFILPPTIALWALIKRPRHIARPAIPKNRGPRWKLVLRRWLILGSTALLPLLSYLYLPWAAHNRAGQTWLYADTSDWNTFWFVVTTREWWGLVQFPAALSAWIEALQILFWQQTGQITAVGVGLGLIGLLVARRHLWLLGPPLLAFTLFGLAYKVADLDSMLIPLTVTLCLGVSLISGILLRRLASWLVKVIRVKDEVFRGVWLSAAIRAALSVGVAVVVYLLLHPQIKANYEAVDLSSDWQAYDLVEEVAAIAAAGTPLTIIGQDNSVLPDFIYTKVVLGYPVTPLSTTTLARMPVAESQALIQKSFDQGRRVLIDIETVQLGFIPWLSQAINQGTFFLAPTGHPYLWELLPRPMPGRPPVHEPLSLPPPNQFVEGQLEIVAYHEQIVAKRTGCFLRLSLFWRTNTSLAENYNVSVQPLGGETALDKNDHLALMRGYLPTSDMIPGEVVRDEVDLLIRQPAALPGISLVVNVYQVQGNQFPTFGEVTLPITVEPTRCTRPGS